MQNISMMPASFSFRLCVRRLSHRSRHWKMKDSWQLQNTFRHHQLSHNLHSVSKMKLCDLCGKVSGVAQTRTYAYQSGNIGSDNEGAVSDGDIDAQDQHKVARTVLYPDCSDKVVMDLAEAASIQEVFSIVERQNNHLTPAQICQAVVTLWDVLRVFKKCGSDMSMFQSVEYFDLLHAITQHPTFNRLISYLETIAETLETDALCYLLLYLFRLEVDNCSPLMQKLLMLCGKNIESLNLRALSLLSVYLRNQGLGSYYLRSKIVGTVEEKLRSVSTCDEMNYITICLKGSLSLLSESASKEYDNVLLKLSNEGKLEDCKPHTLLKFLHFSFHRAKVGRPVYLYRQLMLMLSSKVHTLSEKEITKVAEYSQTMLEPREVMYKIRERANHLVQSSKSAEERASLMLCIAPFTYLKDKSSFEESIIENLHSDDLFNVFPVIFRLLRSIKSSNFKLCNAVWSKALLSVEEKVKEIEGQFFGLEEFLCRRIYTFYMYFNNNLAGTYRHRYLERKMTSLLLKEIRGQCGNNPRKLALMSSFVIAYCEDEGIPEDILKKILSNSEQLNISEIVTLSRGIDISSTFHRKSMLLPHAEQFSTLCHTLNGLTEKYLNSSQSLSLLMVCDLTRAFLHRGGSPRTYLFDTLVNAHIPRLGNLNSRLVKDISSYLKKAKYSSSKILEAMAEYVIENQDYILGETVETYLSCIYSLGFHPESFDRFFPACINILNQDGNNLSGSKTLEVSLALCLYGYLRTESIQNIFSIPFLDQLEDEIDACYSKAVHPRRVRQRLMELNRAVCIDLPEEKIPWFHEKYCQDWLETVTLPKSNFHIEVHEVLSHLVGGSEVVKSNVCSPYYYLIDFWFILDEENKPVQISDDYTHRKTIQIENKPGQRQMAVLVRNENSYCVNSRKLLGSQQMQRRHLEILGFEVVEIPHFMWFSMAHATGEDRWKYLQTLIYS